MNYNELTTKATKTPWRRLLETKVSNGICLMLVTPKLRMVKSRGHPQGEHLAV
jgi:hypothetical protein